MRLVQWQTADGLRRVGLVDEPRLRIVRGTASVYDLARAAVQGGMSLADQVRRAGEDGAVAYDDVVAAGRMLAPLDHPEPARFHVTGTGLTHLGSAEARSKMHATLGAGDLTDSMKIFKMGLEGGKPSPGTMGVQPEWFYKGNGMIVVPPGAPLPRPAFAQDGGEEPEIAGLYLVGDDGTPWRIGYVLANEFSDHLMEQVNYLYLAHSKLRDCSIGPEILVGDLPANVRGRVSVERKAATLWSSEWLSGEDNMTHTIANLEAHQFKYPFFRRPGDLHCHFFGTGAFSFRAGIRLEDSDVMAISAEGFGRPLRNPVAFARAEAVTVRAL